MYDNLKVWEYMDFFASCYGYSGLVARERCMELLKQVKLDDRSDAFVDSLSRGMKQRLCLARALIHDPKLLVLDEPLHGLDLKNRQRVREIIQAFCQRPHKTLIMVTHYKEELPECMTHSLTLKKN
jgi:ABC-2 type transport system ATP-binding protein